jgi:hypothetical protein
MNSTNMKLSYRIRLWFLRHFLLFRLIECESERLAGLVKKHYDENTRLQEKIVSDAALIESLNRYIEALEGKAAMQAEIIQKLNTLLAMTGNQKEENNG